MGKRLKLVRTYYGDKQKDMAKKLNVSLSTVKSWERDNSNPTYDVLIEICKQYQVSADYLLGISKEDSFTEKKTQEKLLPREKALVQLFEEFMLYKQQKETKK